MSIAKAKPGASAPNAIRVSSGDRWAARIARLGASPKAVVTSPEPLWTGDAASARRLASGLFLFGGALVEAKPGASPWDQSAPTAAWEEALHGFDWLDDLVASSDPATQDALKQWLYDWIDRYGGGVGPGWRPDLTGRRLTRWICHAIILLNGAGPERSRAFFTAIGRQTRFLRRRWKTAPPGLPRFQAAAGLVYAGLALEGAGGATIREGIAALGWEAATSVGDDGGLPSRNPEHLVEVFSILVWAKQSLMEAGEMVNEAHEAALDRLAGAIRAMRHGDGVLARFHGGGGGNPERIDRALSVSEMRPHGRTHHTMGFHRIANGGTLVLFDGGAAPEGHWATTVHASAFCFEASIGRRQLVVNCGPGARFGDEWRRAARATAAHSGLTIDDMSSARLTKDEGLFSGASKFTCIREEDARAVRLIAEHDGYLKTHGLMHQRRISLSPDGGDLRGEDRVIADAPGAQALFDQVAGPGTVPFTIRFHLHPDVEADIFLAGGAVRLKTADDDVWVMRQLGGRLTIEDSVFLDEGRLTPRATKQIVVRAEAREYRGEVKWALRRAEADRPRAEG
ncbi:MAG: heparinase II/III family protein [Pseudomonadota bacterium]